MSSPQYTPYKDALTTAMTNLAESSNSAKLVINNGND